MHRPGRVISIKGGGGRQRQTVTQGKRPLLDALEEDEVEEEEAKE